MNTSIFDRRRAGLLAPVYALRHSEDFGIGDTISVKQAIDFCKETGFTVLQVLPVLETIGDHSPYSPISSRALNPALLSLTPESVPGLSPEMIAQAAPPAWLAELRTGNVRHDAVIPLKMQLLLDAHAAFVTGTEQDLLDEFTAFKAAESKWLQPYTLYRLLVREYEGNAQWPHWRPQHRGYPSAEEWIRSDADTEALSRTRDGYAYIQWVAWRQWRDVRSYADEQGIRLIGDLTFGISAASSDRWADPTLFDEGWSMGTRPLTHFDTSKEAEKLGQNWGFPPYRWENHRSSSFEWFKGRLASMAAIFHGCRIDHLRGYFRAYMFPWPGGAKHVEFSHMDEAEIVQHTNGLLPRFVPGPDEEPFSASMNEIQGRELLSKMFEAGGTMDYVAEIMGEMPDYMANTLEELQLPNLNFPQLLKDENGSIIPPDRFREFALVTYANHDNAPLASLFLHLREKALADTGGAEAQDLRALLAFAGWTDEPPVQLDGSLLVALQRALFATSARLAVLMCTDLLGLPIRFNLPGSYGKDTWNERLPKSLAEYLNDPDYGPLISKTSEFIKDSGR